MDFDDHERTVESDAIACNERCAGTEGCVGSSYWSDGGCHLVGDGATLVRNDNVISYDCRRN